MLRNGIAVIGFTMLEDFIKTRTSEIISKIGDGQTKFEELSESLQKATVVDIIDSIKFQTKFEDSNIKNRIKIHQAVSAEIASTLFNPYSLPEKTFGYSKSNINLDTIHEILSSLWCSDGWGSMGGVASKCNAGVIDLRSAFKNAASRRHSAAHNASAQIEYTEISDFVSEIIAIAMSFDLLASIALRKILNGDKDYINGHKKISNGTVCLRFIEEENGKFKEKVILTKRAVSVSKTLDESKAAAYPRAKINLEAVVVKDARGLPVEWATPYLD